MQMQQIAQVHQQVIKLIKKKLMFVESDNHDLCAKMHFISYNI